MTGLPQEARKISNKQSNATSKRTRRIATNKAQSKQKKVIKIRTEINDIETERTIQNINKTKSWFFKKKNKIDKPLNRQTDQDGKREDPQK